MKRSRQMERASHTLGIDFGSQNIGIALVRHSTSDSNEILYAGTLTVNPKALSSLVSDRTTSRRTRRTLKTKKRRLRLLKNALQRIVIEEDALKSIISFSRRRGYSWARDYAGYEKESAEKEYYDFSISRDEFFSFLKKEIERLVSEDKRGEVFNKCRNILDREIRPSRFMNRNPSKCRWEDCNRNVSSARKAVALRLKQSLFVKLLPIFDFFTDDNVQKQEFTDSLNAYIAEFNELASSYQKALKIDEEEQRKAEIKGLNDIYKRKKAEFKKHLLSTVKPIGKDFTDNLKSNFNTYYSKEMDNIVKKSQSGRVSFCKEHSDAFIQHMLEHKAIPYKQTIEERDIISKQQQVAFNKIWRFIEARLIPLSERKIDGIAVERNAFDLLAIPFGEKINLSEAKTNALYWYGARYGYKSTREMLYTEFGGHCSYCGNHFPTDELLEVEHILPKARFGFDNYFNLTLSCKGCNKIKGERTAYEAGLAIHENAYNAYSEYVKKRGKLRHQFHIIKKGILNLMRRKDMEAETLLAIIGQNLLEATATQRSPRPLARYLAKKINEICRANPKIKYVAGRHTAFYRNLLFPDFDKLTDKLLEKQEDSINHALDACLLAFKMPDVSELERGRYAYRDIEYWTERAKSLAPKIDDAGLPLFRPPDFIIDFEKPSKINPSFCTVDILSTAWNKKDSATQKQNPYGMTKQNMPIKKQPASEVLMEILNREDSEKLRDYINNISHKVLKEYLLKATDTISEEKPNETVAQRLVEWLRKSIRGSVVKNSFSSHPSSLMRKKYLEDFLNTDLLEVLKSPQKHIPPNVSIRMLDLGVRGKVDVKRMDRLTGQIIHHYMCQPAVKMKIIAYKSLQDGTVNREKPFVFDVRQNWQVLKDKVKAVEDESHVLNGRVLSSGVKEKDFLRSWNAELKRYLENGFREWHFLQQGCYVEYGNGEGRFIRNFDKTAGFKKEILKGIIRVYRSPYQWVGRT